MSPDELAQAFGSTGVVLVAVAAVLAFVAGQTHPYARPRPVLGTLAWGVLTLGVLSVLAALWVPVIL